MSSEKVKHAARKASSATAWLNHPIGYPRLSERMGVKPETLIFRKFVALNARILLYKQAELAILEQNLRETERSDREEAKGNKHRYATSYMRLLQSPKDGDPLQLELLATISSKLEKYSEFII